MSPMQRTLQTAYYMFKNHPNFNSMKFIVLPELREKLQVVADTPFLSFKELQKQFKEKFGNNFNTTSYFEKNVQQDWFLSDLD